MTPEVLMATAKEKMLDGVIIQRTAIPSSMVKNLITVLTKSDIPYSLDLDDDLLDVPADKDPHRTYENYKPALRHLIASAFTMTVSTPALQEKMKTMHPRVVLLPNQLSDRNWRVAPEPRLADNTVRALYMGTSTHDDDLALVLPALDSVAQSCPNFRLSLVGVTTRKDLMNGRSWLEILDVPTTDYVNFTKWIHSQTQRFDFAIAPLRDTSFNRYKSDLKLLDCGALGLPVIASDISVYRTTNAPGVRLVRNDDQAWTLALLDQVAAGLESRDSGKKLRQWVLRERMLAKTLPEFDRLILELVAVPDATSAERKLPN
jgi:glycosyltransferase involved in cell wall biosynthesis